MAAHHWPGKALLMVGEQKAKCQGRGPKKGRASLEGFCPFREKRERWRSRLLSYASCVEGTAMPGARLRSFRLGDRSELLVEHLLAGFAFTVTSLRERLPTEWTSRRLS